MEDRLRWEQVQAVFHSAVSLPKEERRGFLRTACRDDGELESDVLALLDEDERSTSFLERSLAEVAHQVLHDQELPLKEIGQYRIARVLGEGGMGVVYLAQRQDLRSLAAIKVLRDAWLSPARRERFTREQQTLAQLNHPSIASLYDADVLADGTPWFAMEYVEGMPLTEYCRRHSCSVEQRLQLFRAVAEAVQYAHSEAVIHRDLKPSNILVKKDGSVRLLDFGIAKHLEAGTEQVDLTLTGLRLMTPAYASPEQVRGERVGISTDVYSLGVILYELLADEPPFDLSNLTPAEAATIIVDHEPGRPSVAARQAPHSATNSDACSLGKAAWADLDVLCLTAMHKDSQRRYRSVEAVIRDVDHYLKGEPLEARPDTLRYRTAKFVRRNWNSVATAVLVLAIIVGVVGFFTVRLAKARDAATAEAARTQRIQQFMTNLFQGGDEAAGPSDSLRVVTLVDRGVQQARSLTNDPKVQAELYKDLGVIYQKLGRFDQANSLLQSAAETRRSIFGSDSVELADSLTALGLLRSDQAHLDEAEQLVRQGLEMSRRHLPADHPAVAKALLAYGKVLGERGSYDPAIQALNEAVRVESITGRPSADFASALSTLAAVQYSAGHYDISSSLYARVLEMHRRLYGDRHPLVADDLSSLGSIQQDLGYYDKAEQLDRQALEITEAYYGKEHPHTATIMTMVGRALEYQNKFDESVNVLQQALAIQERVFGPVHPSVAETVNELGNVASMCDHYDQGEILFKRVVEIYRSLYGDHHYLVAIALSNLAYVYLNKKDYPRAEQLFRDVVRRFTDTLSGDNVNTGIARIKLGRTLLRENRYEEASVETRTGYEILSKQTSPSISYLRAARRDLVAEYGALNQPQEAARFQAELAGGVPILVRK